VAATGRCGMDACADPALWRSPGTGPRYRSSLPNNAGPGACFPKVCVHFGVDQARSLEKDDDGSGFHWVRKRGRPGAVRLRGWAVVKPRPGYISAEEHAEGGHGLTLMSRILLIKNTFVSQYTERETETLATLSSAWLPPGAAEWTHAQILRCGVRQE
jgi:hypothetical protein